MTATRQENTHRALGAVLFGAAVIWIGAEAALLADAEMPRDFFRTWMMTNYILVAIGVWAAVAMKRDLLVIVGALAAALGALGLAYSTGAMIPNDAEGIAAIEDGTVYMVSQGLLYGGVIVIGLALIIGRRTAMMMPLGVLLVATAAFAAAGYFGDLARPWQPIALIVFNVGLLGLAVAASSPDRWLVRREAVSLS